MELRRLLYALVGVVLSSYVVLFILVVSRHIDQGVRDEVRRALSSSQQQRPLVITHQTRALVRKEVRRRIQACTIPRFRTPPGIPTALASFPGSGNTWIRFLVQQATGVLTGSVYRDYSLRRNGFPGESVSNGSVLLVKTHEWGQEARARFKRAVLLVREPQDALLAEFHRRAGGHVGHASHDKFTKGNAWMNFAQTHSRLWMESVLDWLQFEGPLLVVRYEEIRKDLQPQLLRLLRFLRARVPPPVLRCALRNKDGIFRRPKKNLPFELFDAPLRQLIDGYKEEVEIALRQHNASHVS